MLVSIEPKLLAKLTQSHPPSERAMFNGLLTALVAEAISTAGVTLTVPDVDEFAVVVPLPYNHII